jgi:hypothetical protein
MKTFSFAHLPPLRDFQFLTDSSGFVLTQTGQLYRFTGPQTALVVTPAAFTVSHFHFLDQTHGAVIGTARPGPLPLQKSALSTMGLPVLVLLWLVWRTRRRARQLLLSLSALLLGGSCLYACSPAWQRYRTADPTSLHASYLTAPPLHRKTFHSYLANKGQTTFIARTQDQGRSWDTQPIPTNFFLTALIALGQNYLVGTYANEQGGPIPLHGDGDVYLYGTDAHLTKELAANSPQHPYGLSLSRGVKGFFTSLRLDALYLRQ